MASHIAIPGNPTKRAYATVICANIPVCFEGDPGEGKSATINADGEASGYFVRTLVGSVRDSSGYTVCRPSDCETIGVSNGPSSINVVLPPNRRCTSGWV